MDCNIKKEKNKIRLNPRIKWELEGEVAIMGLLGAVRLKGHLFYHEPAGSGARVHCARVSFISVRKSGGAIMARLKIMRALRRADFLIIKI